MHAAGVHSYAHLEGALLQSSTEPCCNAHIVAPVKPGLLPRLQRVHSLALQSFFCACFTIQLCRQLCRERH